MSLAFDHGELGAVRKASAPPNKDPAPLLRVKGAAAALGLAVSGGWRELARCFGRE